MAHIANQSVTQPVPHIVVMPGDGIGPEVMAQAVKVLQVFQQAGLAMQLTELPVGGSAIMQGDVALPAHSLAAIQSATAVLLGPVGGPAFDHLEPALRPESALLHIRRELGLFACLRHIYVPAELAHFSPLQADIASGVDLLVVRELTQGVYTGRPQGIHEVVSADGRLQRESFDTARYGEAAIRQVAHCAFQHARARRGLLTSIDKANVLASSRLWRAVLDETAQHYPDVLLEHMYADTAATRLFTQPRAFDVIVADNLFGDLLGDMGSGIVGSVGLLANALIGLGPIQVFEAGHGSAPDIAGQNQANPIATLRATALMLRFGLQRPELADALEQAVATALKTHSVQTADLRGNGRVVGTAEMGETIVTLLREQLGSANKAST